MSVQSVIKLQSEEHDIINPDFFASKEDYVIHLMHLSDYQRAQSIVSDKVVLDLGCNSGYGTNLLSEKAIKIIGVDVSSLAIETAKSKYKKNNLNFQLVDGIKLPFEDATFDAVTSFQVIEHLVDYEIYFNEIKRVLRPSGVLILTTPNAEIRVKSGQKPWNRFHVHEFSIVELGELVKKYFDFSTVIGQHANGLSYSTEYERCIRARDAIVSKRFTIKRFIRDSLPDPLVEYLRSLKSKAPSNKSGYLSDEEKKNYSLSDFFYKNSNNDVALSLVACCSNNKTSKNAAVKNFIPDNE